MVLLLNKAGFSGRWLGARSNPATGRRWRSAAGRTPRNGLGLFPPFFALGGFAPGCNWLRPLGSRAMRATSEPARTTGSRRSRERDPRGERRQLLVLRPGRPDLSPQLVDPMPQLVLGDAERRLALLPDRPLRDGDCVQSARLGALQQRTLIEPPLRRVRECV